MSSEALRIAILLEKGDSLAFDQHFGCEISIKQNIATASNIQVKLAYYKLFHDIALCGVPLKTSAADNHDEREQFNAESLSNF